MKNSCPLALLLILSTFLSARAEPEKTQASDLDFVVHEGLVYSEETDLKLDLFLARDSPTPVPCVLVIQGGGFMAQDGQRFRPFAEHLAKNGLAAALVGYRGRPDHAYRDTIADLKAAVRYVRKNSEAYGIAPDQIGATGRSAGATLAALLAVTGDVDELEGTMGNPEFSSRIQAAVGISGVYDFVARFTSEEQKVLQPNWKKKQMTNGEWVGVPFSPRNRDWLMASSRSHIDANDAPVLLIHSKDDRVVPWQQSQDFYNAMQAVGIKSEITISDSGGHSGPDNAKQLMTHFFLKLLVEGNHGTE